MTTLIRVITHFCFINVFLFSDIADRASSQEIAETTQGPKETQLKLLGFIASSTGIEIAYSPADPAYVTLYKGNRKEEGGPTYNDTRDALECGRVRFDNLLPYELYTIEVQPNDREKEKPLTVVLRTNTAEPSEIRNPHTTWAETGISVKLTWDEPKNENGPIDGYLVQKCFSLAKQCVDGNEHTQTETCLELTDIKGTRESVHEAERNPCYDSYVKVYAYNKPLHTISDILNQKLENDFLKSAPTLFPIYKHVPRSNSAALIVFIVLSVSLALLVCGYAGRKYYIKHYT